MPSCQMPAKSVHYMPARLPFPACCLPVAREAYRLNAATPCPERRSARVMKPTCAQTRTRRLMNTWSRRRAASPTRGLAHARPCARAASKHSLLQAPLQRALTRQENHMPHVGDAIAATQRTRRFIVTSKCEVEPRRGTDGRATNTAGRCTCDRRVSGETESRASNRRGTSDSGAGACAP